MATADKFPKGKAAKEEAREADTKGGTSDPTMPEPKKTESKDPEPKKGETNPEEETTGDDFGSGASDSINRVLEDILQDPGEAELYQQNPNGYLIGDETVPVEANNDTNSDVSEDDAGDGEFGGGSPEDNATIGESLTTGESSDDNGAVDGEIAEDVFVPVVEAPADESASDEHFGFGSPDGVNVDEGSNNNNIGNDDEFSIDEDTIDEVDPDTDEGENGLPSLADATVDGFFDTSHLQDADASLSDSIVDDDLFDA